MGGFFGAVSANDCVLDVFYGTDYHSHLGTRRGGMTSYSAELGFQRNIHSIENSPFRTKFEKDVEKMRGNICIGCISDTDPQPIMVRSKLGLYAVCSIGIIQNAKALSEELLESGCANFETMSSGNINSGGLIGALIAQKPTFVEGIRYAQSKIEGTMSLVIMTEDSIICARDRAGKLPILIGKRSDGYCFSFESFAYQKLGYETCHELKAGEITCLTKDGYEVLYEGTENEDLYLPLDVLRVSYRLLRGRECRSDAYQKRRDHGGERYEKRKASGRGLCLRHSGFRRSPRHWLRQPKRHSICKTVYQVYTHMAEKLHASQSVHAESGCKNEAGSCSGTHSGQETSFRR